MRPMCTPLRNRRVSRCVCFLAIVGWCWVLLPAVNAEPPASGISDDVVRIGVLSDYGSGRDLGGPGSVTAAKLAADDFNNKVLGKPIAILAADHQNKPDTAVAIARQWFEFDHVDAITDLAVSSVGLAVAHLASTTGHMVLISGAATSDLTSAACSPFITHWADDTYALSAGLVRAVSERVAKSWYFVAVDYSFGSAMLRDSTNAVIADGGTVVGSVRFPFNTADFATFLLGAQASGAKILALASTGNDTVRAVKQAHEFGLPASGMTIVGMLTFIADVHALGLKDAQGMYIASQYYWDDDDVARVFAKRFFAIENHMPTKLQAATYASVRHYLKAIQAAGTDDAKIVGAQMRKMDVDFFGRPARIRPDGRVVYDLSLYRVKAPADSRYAWDYYEKIKTISGEHAFRAEGVGGCKIQ
jgi:branched-chain amino acid transport system substrate-binding protein